eukprot:1817371-Prymnesium_polylepis.1
MPTWRCRWARRLCRRAPEPRRYTVSAVSRCIALYLRCIGTVSGTVFPVLYFPYGMRGVTVSL